MILSLSECGKSDARSGVLALFRQQGGDARARFVHRHPELCNGRSAISPGSAALIKFLSSVTPAIREYASLLKVTSGECPNYANIISAGCQELVRLAASLGIAAHPPRNRRRTCPSVDATPSIRLRPPHSTITNRIASHVTTITDFTQLSRRTAAGAHAQRLRVEKMIGRAMGVVLKGTTPPSIDMWHQDAAGPKHGAGRGASVSFTRPARLPPSSMRCVAIYAISEVNGLPYWDETCPHVAARSLDQQAGCRSRTHRYGRQIAAV